jgi:putative tryptophan/tyrosine transport system substrate-binding protein
MKRRDFISLLGSTAVAWPLAARAQQTERVRRIGFLIAFPENDREAQARITAFREGLQALGWTEGRNIRIDYHFAVADLADIETHVAELVNVAPDVIVGQSTPVTAALKQATRSIPIVIAAVNDPVGQGFVESLARPGGNITGFTFIEFAIVGKWLEMLKEIAPGVRRVLLVFNPETAPYYPIYLSELPATLAAELSEARVRHRVPAIYGFREFVARGGLMSYGPDAVDITRRSAGYVDRILKGENPANLPFQQPTKFQLVINLKTAKALGLEIPDKLLALADEVIE